MEKIVKTVAQEEALKCFLCFDAPCSKACPAGSNPDKFIQAVRFADLYGAEKVLCSGNVWASVCAEKCEGSKYCERACIRTKIGSPVQIQKVHQYVIQNAHGFFTEKSAYIGKIAVCSEACEGLILAGLFVEKGYQVSIITDKSEEEYLASLSLEMQEDLQKMLGTAILLELSDKFCNENYDIVVEKKRIEEIRNNVVTFMDAYKQLKLLVSNILREEADANE